MSDLNASEGWFSRPFKNLWDLGWGLDLIWLLLSIVAGIACTTFVAATWVLHLVHAGSYLWAGLVTALALALSLAALVRIPLALFVLFGGVAFVAAAFFGGYSHLLLP
jgi:hypothetical protein